jgi:type II restriction enzyme
MKITQSISKAGFSNYEQAFDDFYGTLRPSLKLWDYFVNWEKVFRNTKQIEIQLNLWNYLLGKEDFDKEFIILLEQHPEIVKAIPSMVVRDGSGSSVFSVVRDIGDLTKPDLVFDFSQPASTSELRHAALEFFKSTGLNQLFKKDGVKNLVDYVLGVEAGLDSNGRKNRSGTSMETVVESYLAPFCHNNKLEYLSQATPNAIKDKWGFAVPVDKSSRRFDFAISNGKTLVLMEVNFYGGGGSKLKATAGEYKGLNDLLKVPNTKFVWVTDGEGWHTTREPLRSAYIELDHLWNLDWLYRDYLADLFGN